jgi:hypothetical protein
VSQQSRFYKRYPRYLAIQRRYRDLTMISKRDYVDNLFVVDYWRPKLQTEPGCVIECGTWRGGMLFGLMDLCPDVREFHCFDSFQGLPPAEAIDGAAAVEQQRQGALIANNNTASRDEFEAGLRRHQSHRLEQVSVHEGWFEDTLESFKPERPISVLRLDGDWYASTRVVLERLYDHVPRGGIILIDDYMHWVGCSRAVHDFLSERQSRDRLRASWRRGVTYILKDHPGEDRPRPA